MSKSKSTISRENAILAAQATLSFSRLVVRYYHHHLHLTPPWERNYLPFLVIDDDIVWVHGIGVLGVYGRFGILSAIFLYK